MQPCGWDDKHGYCVLVGCQRSTRCAWRVAVHLPVWSPESHLGVLTDRPAPTSGKIVPGKSRRLKRT